MNKHYKTNQAQAQAEKWDYLNKANQSAVEKRGLQVGQIVLFADMEVEILKINKASVKVRFLDDNLITTRNASDLYPKEVE